MDSSVVAVAAGPSNSSCWSRESLRYEEQATATLSAPIRLPSARCLSSRRARRQATADDATRGELPSRGVRPDLSLGAAFASPAVSIADGNDGAHLFRYRREDGRDRRARGLRPPASGSARAFQHRLAMPIDSGAGLLTWPGGPLVRPRARGDDSCLLRRCP